MTRPVLPLLAIVALLVFTPAIAAEEPGKIDLEASELTADLIGAPVFAADGKEVGLVVDVSSGEDGLPSALRVETDANLGFGTRSITLSQQLFTTLQGAVVIDLPAEAIRSLPEPSRSNE
jgi:hypothetical protein